MGRSCRVRLLAHSLFKIADRESQKSFTKFYQRFNHYRPSLQKSHLMTASGQPYGVGQVELQLSVAIAKGWHSDQIVEVVGTDYKIWLRLASN